MELDSHDKKNILYNYQRVSKNELISLPDFPVKFHVIIHVVKCEGCYTEAKDENPKDILLHKKNSVFSESDKAKKARKDCHQPCVLP